MNMTNDGITYSQRDIVLIPFPYTDLTASKLRPALIMSNKRLETTNDRICCLITSNPSQKGGILIERKNLFKGDLKYKSWVKPYRIFTVDIRIIKKRLGTISISCFDRLLKEMYSYMNKEKE